MDFSKVKTYSIKKRKSKVDKRLFAFTNARGCRFASFFDSLPNVLKANELKEVVSSIVQARGSKNKPVMLLSGAHVIKCGLSPIVIELIEREIITSVAFTGAGIIHDFEIAYCGQTSEDVAEALKDGSFGMAQETAEYLNAAVAEGVREGRGFGDSVGLMMERKRLKYRHLSIAYACFKKRIPLTVHVAIGTDIIHQHPSAKGSDIGEASMRDFRKFCDETARLDRGGVVLNFGSAVILPEVFLKALSVARNITGRVGAFTTVNFDMNIHYRPMQNIVVRPTQGSGKGFYIVGHHEIMLPLLAQAVLEKIR